MRFGAVPVGEAAGAVLAHGLRIAGLALKKGRVLSPEDTRRLAAAGLTEVVVARLDGGDVAEDEAAAAVAAAIAGDGLDVAVAFSGRCNLYAAEAGLAVIDRVALDTLNGIDERITVATVHPHVLVTPRQRVATVKIIPFAVPAAALRAATSVARAAGPLLRVAPLVPHRAGLIQTRLAGSKDSVLDKTARVTEARLAALGSELAASLVVDHDAEAVAAALGTLSARGLGPLLVVGASAIVDRRDVIPAALVAAGGTVVRLGMPVEPGNLLMMGRLGDTAVIGLPGCARSPKVNGFDWVLWRLLAGLVVGPDEVRRMGAGGLIGDGDDATRGRDAGAGEPRIAAVVLAAGRSTRMAGVNKLLTTVDGRPLVTLAVDAALASRARPVVVVVGHEAAGVRAALADRPVTVVDNLESAGGISTSIRAGLAALPAGVDGALIMLADMPRVGDRHLDRLIAAFAPEDGRTVCVPTRNGVRGNPVLWGRAFFPMLAALTGDVGGRDLLRGLGDGVCEVAMADDGVLVDVDTPEMAARLASIADTP